MCKIVIVLQILLIPVFSGCRQCDKIGQVKCEGNVSYICRYAGAELPQNWSKQMDCSNFDAKCKIIDNNFDFEPLNDGKTKQLSYEYEWEGTKAAVCVPEEDCSDINIVHCGRNAMYSYLCVNNQDKLVPMIWSVNNAEFDVCVESASDTDVVFAFDTDTCINGESECIDDNTLRSCIDGFWKYEFKCNTTHINMQTLSYYRCFENEVDTDGILHALCAADIGECVDDEFRCLTEGGDVIVKCANNTWIYSYTICGDDRACYTKDDGTYYCR